MNSDYRKKYLFVIPTLSNGGAERVVSVLASALYKQGQEVCIVKYYATENEYPVVKGVKIINLSGGIIDDYDKIGYLKKVKKLRNIIKKELPDFIFPFLFQVALCTAFATLFVHTNVIQSIRINPFLGPKLKILRGIRNFLVYQSKCTIVQNSQQKKYFLQNYQRKIHVVFNPVSEDLLFSRWNPNHEQYIICGVGRLEKQKNFRLLMDSFKNAFADIPNVILRIYGEGTLEEELRQYAYSLGMRERIQLMGRSNNLKEVYENASMFVLSSDYEGLPNSLIEAMAVGVPSISTDCPTGPSELIDDRENGILVPVGDVGAMVMAMKSIYYDDCNIHKMSDAAKKKISRLCSPEVIAKQIMEICDSII